MDVLELLKRLIEYPSITPSHAGSLDYIASILVDSGFKVHYLELGSGKDKTANLYARFGNTKPHLCFAGHVDVVPPGDEANWTSDPFMPTINGDILVGRGVADMKGALAAMISASQVFLKQHQICEGSLSFLLTADEEGKATFGTAAMLNQIAHIFDPDFCIVGEPTSLMQIGDVIKIGRRGSVNFTLELFGKQGHVAYPELAKNPINFFAPLLEKLVNLKLDEGTEFFDASHLEVTSIDVGNPVRNIIPRSIRCLFNIRYNNLQTPERLYHLLDSLISQYAADYKLSYSESAECFFSGPSDYAELLKQAVLEITSYIAEYRTNGGTSDARFIKDYCPLAEIGFLSDEAHKVDEQIKISDLQKLYDVYYRFLEKFFYTKSD